MTEHRVTFCKAHIFHLTHEIETWSDGSMAGAS
jgi:hypothetical protein